MPRITIETNKSFTNEQKSRITEQAGLALEQIPKEKAEYLMIDFKVGMDMCFGKYTKDPCACVEINILDSVYEKTPQSILEQVLARITGIVCANSNIKPEQMYVLFRNSKMWAYQGANIEKTLLR